MLLGCIADDFTGATDLGALLAREGLRVTLRVGLQDDVPDQPCDAMIIALKSRNIPAADAVAQSRAALDVLTARLQAERIYFKYCSTFDSTDKGNIGPVLDALMADMGVDRTLASPGFPENGRRLLMGHMFVGDRLLSESSLARHPLTPMTDPDIVRVLSRQRTAPVGLLSRPLIEQGSAAVRAEFEASAPGSVFICDAVTTADLDALAGALSHLKLYSGGSAFAGALARQLAMVERRPDNETRSHQHPNITRPIILSGSGSDMTQRQVRFALSRGIHGERIRAQDISDPAAAARNMLARFTSGATVPMIYATAQPTDVTEAQVELGVVEAGERIEAFFECLAEQARADGYNAFVIAGGETSGAAVRGLGLSSMDIGAEVAPGVPWMQSEDIRIILKSGNFGQEPFFFDALSRIGFQP